MSAFQQRVNDIIQNAKGRLLVAVSGGADSVALLHCLHHLQKEIIVAHCNFHLRGEESDRDQKFVALLCQQLNLQLLTTDFDVESYCKANKVSIEMACRELRYQWFETLATQYDCSRIVVAHNADDNIETLLLNLFRGTGIEGLKGMKADNGKILRPLLDFTRKEIEEYLSSINARYVSDSTNFQSDYKRNYIRNILLPQLETRWSGVRSALRRSISNLAGAEKIYQAKVAELLPDTPNFISRDALLNSPDSGTLLYEFLKQRKVNESIINEMISALSSQYGVGKKWVLHDCEVVLERDGFHILEQTDSANEVQIKYDAEYIDNTPETINIVKHNRDHNIVYLPGNIEQYRFRHPESGDRISPLGMNGSSLVSDILKDAKLTTLQRREYWLLEEINTGKIIWLPNIKRSRHSLISPDTPKILKITIKS